MKDVIHNVEQESGSLPIGAMVGTLESDGFMHAVRFINGPADTRLAFIPFRLPDVLVVRLDDGRILVSGERDDVRVPGHRYRRYAKGRDPQLLDSREKTLQGGVYLYEEPKK